MYSEDGEEVNSVSLPIFSSHQGSFLSKIVETEGFRSRLVQLKLRFNPSDLDSVKGFVLIFFLGEGE